MKSLSIIAITLLALVALSSSVPVTNQQIEDQARFDFYNDFFAGLASNLVSTVAGSLQGLLTTLITENPLNVGKRDVETDLQARVNPFTFLYENVLQQFFTGIVTNAFGAATDGLLNLIETNPLGVGKRDVESRVNPFTFLYENVLQQFFTGIVENAFGAATSGLLNLIETNPLGVGKRDVEADLQARFDFYQDFLAGLFSGLVSTVSNAGQNLLTTLISENGLGVGKRDVESRVNPFTFLYENVLQQFFTGIVENAFGAATSGLLNLIETNPLGVGKRSVNIQQIQTIIAQITSVLSEQFKTFVHQAISSLNDRQKLNELIKENIVLIKATITGLAQQLSTIIPSVLSAQATEVLSQLQSVLVFWTSGLAGSLGPVMGPFSG